MNAIEKDIEKLNSNNVIIDLTKWWLNKFIYIFNKLQFSIYSNNF